jgi:hypothetical protein
MQPAARRQLWILLFLVATACAALVVTRGRQKAPGGPAATPHDLTVEVVVHADLDTLLHRTLESEGPLSALQALEQTCALAALPVGIRPYDFGKLVVSVGKYTAGPDGYWTYRVNGDLVPMAAEACQLKQGDRLVFRFGRASDDSLATGSEPANLELSPDGQSDTLTTQPTGVDKQ